MDIQQKLIELCIKGERRAEYELFKATYSYLISICLRYTRNEEKAKEILNIGFYKILTNLKKYNPEIPFKPWARRVMINTLINEYKKEKIHYQNVHYVDDYIETEKHSEINEALPRLDADRLYQFIAQLPPASQQVFNLYFIDGYKHREIAEMLNISEGTSKWHLNWAREKLKEMLNEIVVPIQSAVNE
ncbi:MAG: sigma-70 family RNA polymerase sigma factor [Bacteroidia bacterium]|nr:sigma-70 family RNA polymerase sigma factor [Bacteroidia bacterium]